jgi:enoyl-[acyl-carrier protein] reductase II
MPRTPLVDLLGIQHPIIQAGMGRFGSGAALAAAVSNAGAIGTIGGAKRSADELRDELTAIHQSTQAPFIVNFTLTWLRLHPECLDVALASRPRAISVSSGLPGDLVPRIHDHGALVIAQVHTVDQARLAAEQGVDVVIAQGAEAGGYGAPLSSLALIPQVVDAVAPMPVVGAGGIVDGRGVAAVLLLGAVGANIGTRFLATLEASLEDSWKERLVETPADERLRLERTLVQPVSADGQVFYTSVPVTPDIATVTEVPVSGLGSGAIRSVLPAAAVVELLVRGAEESLLRAQEMLTASVPA